MELIDYLQELQRQLDISVRSLRKTGQEYASAYRDYRIALAQELLRLKDEGNPATLCGDLARGKTEVANKKFDEIRTEAIYKANLESINALKIQIKVIQEQIGREWTNENN